MDPEASQRNLRVFGVFVPTMPTVMPSSARRALAALVLVCAIALVALLVGHPGPADASSTGSSSVLTLGGSLANYTPSCPSNCEAVGRVTGFQTNDRSGAVPFRATRTGKVVAWSVKLAKPRSSQIAFFNDFYGGKASARISVLRPSTKSRYVLNGQSPVAQLDGFLGQQPIFTLEKPLTIREGYHVALTTSTWAPAFSTGQSRETRWRASRSSSKCDNVKSHAEHTTVGSRRTYGCTYRTARLLYQAFWVRSS